MKLSIGVDIGATNIRVGMIREDGIIVKQVIEKVTEIRTPEALVEQIVRLYESLDPLSYDLVGMGVGIPGPVVPGGGKVYVLPNLRIPSFDIGQVLNAHTHLKTIVLNDANVAGFAEAILGAGKGYGVVQFITISTGIGGGLVMNGKVITGKYGFAQEVGNMIIHPNGIRPNPTMNEGSWETHCSGTSLIRLAADQGITVNHAGEVFLNAKLIPLVNQWIRYMAMAIANMVTLYEPDVFVLGGGVMKSQVYFLEQLRNTVNDYVFHDLNNKVKIVPAVFDQDAGLVGAGLLPFYYK